MIAGADAETAPTGEQLEVEAEGAVVASDTVAEANKSRASSVSGDEQPSRAATPDLI